MGRTRDMTSQEKMIFSWTSRWLKKQINLRWGNQLCHISLKIIRCWFQREELFSGVLFIWVGTFHWALAHGLTRWTWYMNYLNEPPMGYPKCKPLKFLTQKFKNQFVCSCSNLLATIFKRHRFCMHCVPFIMIADLHDGIFFFCWDTIIWCLSGSSVFAK